MKRNGIRNIYRTRKVQIKRIRNRRSNCESTGKKKITSKQQQEQEQRDAIT